MRCREAAERSGRGPRPPAVEDLGRVARLINAHHAPHSLTLAASTQLLSNILDEAGADPAAFVVKEKDCDY